MAVTTDQLDISTISKNATNGDDGYDTSVVDVADFFDRVLEKYNDGSTGDLPAALVVGGSCHGVSILGREPQNSIFEIRNSNESKRYAEDKLLFNLPWLAYATSSAGVCRVTRCS